MVVVVVALGPVLSLVLELLVEGKRVAWIEHATGAGEKGGVGLGWEEERSAMEPLSVTTRAHSVTIWTMLSRARARLFEFESRRSWKRTALNLE